MSEAERKVEREVTDAAISDLVIKRLVRFEPTPNGRRWIVGAGDCRQGLKGVCVGILALRHAPGYEVVLRLDSGKIDSFAPMNLRPDPAAALMLSRAVG